MCRFLAGRVDLPIPTDCRDTDMATERIIIDDKVTAELQRIAKAGGDLTPAMTEISGELLTSAKLNFEGEHDPLGVPWKAVKNPPDLGTILRRSSDLFKSLKNAFGPLFAMAGPERSGGAGIYAAAHQFGARITAKSSKALKTPYGPRKSVTIPARPFVGWNDQLRADTLDILRDHLKGVGKTGETA
jgi:phage virion morphogenesis protein